MLDQMLGIEYPIIQGAMANIATAKFAAAVSNSGALGVIGTGAMNADQARSAILECHSLTDKPFAVNVMLMNPNSDAIMDVICELKPKVVTTGAGNPGKYIEKLKQNGIYVAPIVPTVALAIRMEQAGADFIIVEGTEAGGHVGDLTTMVLVPQVADAVKLPIVAAGGIADGRGYIAALALGAIGVQVGTCLLVADECPIHENYKNAVITAKDTDTVVTGRSVSAPVRIKKNRMSLNYLKLEKEGADREELEKLTLGSLRKAVFDGDVEDGSLMMGQIAGMLKQTKPLKVIFEEILSDANHQIQTVQTKLGERNG